MSGVTIYYMRDNHTFRALPLDVEAAIGAMREERDAGNTYGMLCSQQITNVVHAPSAAEWDDFELRAREWLEAAIKVKVPPTPEEELTRLRAECDALRADAERYRFVRDADRSDCITRELSLYAMESLDEYVDAAMEDEARAALKEAK